ncbi:SUMF1/EgtB/PvdO family nonheme iron enzyme [Salibacter halophilus]|uniref:SUMF1/EgtB/PvdO family nonheme iron enzyme n=1 Tax=Salibacter halophilus TaxID=1803916 RepID=A0A6N6M9Y7_9FLAO|nr:SUMF1/EgtB/PvdO family nonheme iron enzyme [Salibacter halophilus]KAB1065076.1 SUMF1/EgtB/PvdO family nonheme iron enzyme [Salibacter halophilus]
MKSYNSFLIIFLSLIVSSCSFIVLFNDFVNNSDANEGVYSYLNVDKKLHEQAVEYITAQLDTNPPDSIFILAAEHEVSNAQYNRFLKSLRDNNYTDIYQKCKRKRSNWIENKRFELLDERVVNNYHKNYAHSKEYENHPVVNISREAMDYYVEWLNAISTSDKDEIIHYKIPSKEEWLEAYRKNKKHDSAFYPWETDFYLDNNNYKLASFATLDLRQLRQEPNQNELRLSKNKDSAYTAVFEGPKPVDSYIENDYFLNNMAGNVAEIVLESCHEKNDSICVTHGGSWHSFPDKLKKYSTETYSLPSRFVGLRVFVYKCYYL